MQSCFVTARLLADADAKQADPCTIFGLDESGLKTLATLTVSPALADADGHEKSSAHASHKTGLFMVLNVRIEGCSHS
ncbi:MAG: hypothetical protein R3F28_12565 [Candidatus Kapaibacterium sp.]